MARRTLTIVAALAIGLASWGYVHTRENATMEPQIGHMVYFQLNESTPANQQKLVDACKKYLTEHPGVAFFAAGVVAKEQFNRPVNDNDWDVALHVVFKTKADHDKYQDAPRHIQFIDENKATWKKVRVFDSLIAPAK